jgi:hypothetical protein
MKDYYVYLTPTKNILVKEDLFNSYEEMGDNLYVLFVICERQEVFQRVITRLQERDYSGDLEIINIMQTKYPEELL